MDYSVISDQIATAVSSQLEHAELANPSLLPKIRALIRHHGESVLKNFSGLIPTPVIQIQVHEDVSYSFYINDGYAGSADYDSVGSLGMATARNIVLNFADALNSKPHIISG